MKKTVQQPYISKTKQKLNKINFENSLNKPQKYSEPSGILWFPVQSQSWCILRIAKSQYNFKK